MDESPPDLEAVKIAAYRGVKGIRNEVVFLWFASCCRCQVICPGPLSFA
jgi:hypothetical protein